MTGDQEVRLAGGPFDGVTIQVSRFSRLVTLDWEEESLEQDWNGVEVYVTRVGLASYRRVSETEFEHCRTPTAMGDDDLALPGQLTIEDMLP